MIEKKWWKAISDWVIHLKESWNLFNCFDGIEMKRSHRNIFTTFIYWWGKSQQKEHVEDYRNTYLPNWDNDENLEILCCMWWMWNTTPRTGDTFHACDWCWLCWRETETPLILTAIGSLMKCIRTGTGGLSILLCVSSWGWYCEKTEMGGGLSGGFWPDGASPVLWRKCLKAKFLTLSWHR